MIKLYVSDYTVTITITPAIESVMLRQQPVVDTGIFGSLNDIVTMAAVNPAGML